jgi:hypothetical protein
MLESVVQNLMSIESGGGFEDTYLGDRGSMCGLHMQRRLGRRLEPGFA